MCKPRQTLPPFGHVTIGRYTINFCLVPGQRTRGGYLVSEEERTIMFDGEVNPMTLANALSLALDLLPRGTLDAAVAESKASAAG